jgi:hypothetical protein
MTFQSPSHAWATWLDRPRDLELAASNGAAVKGALDALDLGDLETARGLWAGINGEELLAAWDAQVAGLNDESRWPASLKEPSGSGVARTTKKLTKPLSRSVFDADGYRCCYCAVPVVTQWQGGDISGLVAAFPEVTPHLIWQAGSIYRAENGGRLTNRDSAKWLWITAVADHVHPASLCGPTEMSNLVTACSACNTNKWDWTLEQLQVRAPTVPRLETSVVGYGAVHDL